MASTSETVDPRRTATRPLRTAGIVGLGTALPEHVVTNAEIAAAPRRRRQVDRAPDRHPRAPCRRSPDAPGRPRHRGRPRRDRGLRPAGRARSTWSSSRRLSHELSTPNAAPLIAHALGATRAGGFDLGCACTGFVAGLAGATAWIEAGRAHTALIIGAELMSRYTDPSDRRTAALFGDGAGAVVHHRGRARADRAVVLGADGSCGEMITSDPETGADHHGRPRDVQAGGRPPGRRPHARRAALPAWRSTTSTCSSTTRPTAGSPRPSASASASTRRGSSTASAASATPRRRASPSRSATPAPPGQLPAGTRVLLAAVGAGFTWGAVVVEWGAAPAHDPAANGRVAA